LDHNQLLQRENELIKAQLTSTQELLDQLRTTQQDRIAALADQLQQQVRWDGAHSVAAGIPCVAQHTR
jgi:hypothetical protein